MEIIIAAIIYILVIAVIVNECIKKDKKRNSIENYMVRLSSGTDNSNDSLSKKNEILHEDLMHTLDKIRFWVTIIGVYVLVKIILIAFLLLAGLTTIIDFLELLQQTIH